MSTGLEISENAGREEVDKVVRSLLQDREETFEGGDDGAGNAGSDEKETSTETTGGDESSAAEAASGQQPAEGDDSDAESEQSWLTDEVRAELPRWITDEDLSGFSSRDELQRALGLLDSAAMKAGRESGQRSSESGSADGSEDGNRSPAEKKDEEGAGATSSALDIDLDLSEFDEELGTKVRGALISMRDHYESRIGAIEGRFAAIEAEAEARQHAAIGAQFDAIVDSLGHADLFGETDHESPKQLEARQKLFDEFSVYMAGLQSLGREGRMDKATVGRVLRMAFAEHISRQEQKNLTKRLRRQSDRRSSVGAGRVGDDVFKGPLDKHPDVQAAYTELQRSRGDG